MVNITSFKVFFNLLECHFLSFSSKTLNQVINSNVTRVVNIEVMEGKEQVLFTQGIFLVNSSS
jgi:hypothetical protein